MEYLMLIYYDEAAGEGLSPGEREAQLAAYRAYTKTLIDANVMRGGNALQGTEMAQSVRARDGKVMITDGPFAETREQLGGYYLIECDTFEEATSWAAKCPAAQTGTMEVRPIWKY